MPTPNDFDDDDEMSLRDEVRQLFHEEMRRVRKNAHKTPNLPPGYYEDGWRKHYLPTECDELWDDSQTDKK